MVDIFNETTFPVANAPKHIPTRPHVATVWRWIQRGCRGVKLESVLVGGVRYTSQEALGRFFQAVTAAADRQSVTNSDARERAIAKAEMELDEDGIR